MLLQGLRSTAWLWTGTVIYGPACTATASSFPWTAVKNGLADPLPTFPMSTGRALTRAGVWFAAVKGLGLLKSADRGNRWTEVALPFPHEQKILLAVQENKLFVASSQHGPFISIDNGTTWEEIIQGTAPKGRERIKIERERRRLCRVRGRQGIPSTAQ